MKYILVEESVFWETIRKGKLDVTVNSQGDWPYTTIFKYRNQTIFGKIVDYYENDHIAIIKSKHYLMK